MKTCKTCIHANICGARKAYHDVIKSWNKEYAFVPMNDNEEILAENCSEFKSLSDIHLIKKEKNY